MINKKYNIFIFPLTVVFVQFCYVFFANINAGWFYEKTVIFFSLFIFLFYLFLFFLYEQKNKTLSLLNKEKILSFILAFILGFFFVKQIWFYDNYMTLNPLKKIFSDNMAHIDTLYHSAIAESFNTNGFPSIQFNKSNFLRYHCFSHFVIAIISKVLSLPALITYNIIYPIIFVPLYLILIQEIIIQFRIYMGIFEKFSVFDIFFLFAFCCFLMAPPVAARFGYYFIDLYVSQSCFVSVCLLLTVLLIILKLEILSKNKNISHINIIKILIVSVGIFFISYSKISTGFIFLFYCCYYLFRKNPLSKKNWSIIFLFLFVFFIEYKIASPGVGEQNGTPFELFSFLKRFVSSDLRVLYYFILFLPSIIIWLCGINNRFFTKEYFNDNYSLFFELSFLGIFVSLLPGTFLVIGGGSALYFVLIGFWGSLFMFWGLDFPKKLLYKLKQKNLIFVLGICLICFFIPIVSYSSPLNTMKSALAQRQCQAMHSLQTKFEKLMFCFQKSDVNQNETYINFNNIYQQIKHNKKEYCIFMNNSFDYSAADYINWVNDEEKLTLERLHSAYLVSGFFGIPVINVLNLIDNNVSKLRVYYTATGDYLGNHISSMYGLETVQPHYTMLKENNAINYARKLGKKYVIFLGNDSFKITSID